MEPSSASSKLSSVFEVGVRVIVNNTQYSNLKGVVRYSGLVPGFVGTMIGVELDKPAEGAHADAPKFFSCRAGTGVFVRATHIKADYDKSKTRVPGGTTVGTAAARKAKEAEASAEKKKAEEKKTISRKTLSKTEDEVSEVAEVSILAEPISSAASDESRSIISDMQRQITNLTKAKKSLEGALEKKDTEIEQLKQAKMKTKSPKIDQSEIIEALTVDKTMLEANVEQLVRENEELREENKEYWEEIETLREEKELQELEMDQLQTGEEAEVGIAELKLAFKKLYSDSQKKEEIQKQIIEDLEERASIVTDLEAQLEQASKVKDLLALKEDEISELKEALDEAAGYRDMIEELTETNLKQSERISELEEQLKEMQELQEIEREIAEDQAELERSLNDEIHNKDIEIQQLLRELESRDEEKGALEKVILQFRTRTSDLSKELNLLREEMKKPGAEQNLGKMQELINANMQLTARLRDLRAQSIDGQLGNFFAALFRAKTEVVLSGLPNKLGEELQLQSYNTVALLRTSKVKAFIVALETAERIADLSQEKKLVNWAYSLATIAASCFVHTGQLEAAWRASSKEEYLEFLRTHNLAQISVAHSYLDSFLKHIKEENFGPALSLDQLSLTVEDVKALTAAFPVRSGRVDLAKEIMMAMATATTFKKLFHPRDSLDSYVAFSARAKALLRSLVFGTQELPEMSVVAERLREKCQTARRHLQGDLEVEMSYEPWIADLDAELKQLSALVRADTDEPERGPWRDIAGDVKGKLEQYDQTFEELVQTQNTGKALALKLAQVEKEASENKIARANLEKRLAEAHAKAQMVSQLELEKKRLQDRQKHYEDSIDTLQGEKETLEDKLSALEETIKSGGYQPDIPGRLMYTGTGLLLSESGGMVNAARGGSMLESYQDEAASESVEVYKSIIEKLQEERTLLTGSYVLSKLQGLELKPLEPIGGLSASMHKLKTLQRGLRKKVASLRLVDLKSAKAKQQLQ
jgi:predicted  nucleic acid-binding Zn-ribbon protein